MRSFFVVLFLITVLTFQAQNVEKVIILKDAETNQPIEDATVLVVKTKQVVLSNAEGKVTFVLKGASNIQISHTSYISTTVRSSTLKEEVNVILLKNNVNNLEEIILTKQHPQKILANLIQNSRKALTVPARLKVYCREFFKMNGIYSYYNDGIMNFQLFDKTKKINSNILVEQNRSIGLIDEDVSADLLGYNLNDIMENYYNFKYLNLLLEPSAKKNFEFLIKVYSANKELYCLTAIPVDGNKDLLDDFTVIYDPKKKLIVEVSSVVSPITLSKVKEKTAIGSKNVYKSFFKAMYRTEGSYYYLVSSKEEIGFDKVEKNKSKSIEVRNYFVTTNFSNQNYIYKDSEVFKDKTLFNKSNVILSNYWNTSGLSTTEEEKNIIESIEDGLYGE